jgi:DNA-binding protein HU-beta
MNKNDLIVHVVETTGVTKGDATKAIESVFQGIQNALIDKEDCQFVGFGSFKVKKRSARTGRNPRTGETIEIKESFTVGFNAGKNLKESLNSLELKPQKQAQKKTEKKSK